MFACRYCICKFFVCVFVGQKMSVVVEVLGCIGMYYTIYLFLNGIRWLLLILLDGY